jgi:glycosyltransferase involved in cell wall biosynthesis
LVELNGATARLRHCLPEAQATDRVDALHVPYTYFPDAFGGTEVYVASLVDALRSQGVAGAVAAPGAVDAAYEHDDVPVFRFATGQAGGLETAYGAPDPTAVRSFEALLAHLRPSIVHLHARTAAVSERLVDAAHRAGAKVVLTYHTPTVSCARGTMMWMGRSPCDGRLDRRRCTACALAQHGVPPLLRDALACMPQTFGHVIGRAGFASGAITALRFPSLIGEAHRRFHDLMRKVERIVAPCDWVRDLLRANRIPEGKLVMCRQGLGRQPPTLPSLQAGADCGEAHGTLRLGYFGRLDPTKGVDIVVEALRQAANPSVQLEIYGIRQPGSEAYATKLERAAAGDPRIAFLPALSPEAVDEAMRRCDLVVVPSRWLETGPLVVLESFAAGTPVLGARLGGIAELVTDHVDGILVAPENPAAWAAAIAALAEAPKRIAELRAGIRPPRTMQDVARDMSRLYHTMLADAEAS